MLFRPDDKRQLDPAEYDEWIEMVELGRRGYVIRRTISAVNFIYFPVIGLVGTVWLGAPQSRPFLLDRFIWIPLVVGAALVGPLTALYAWDKWRSYERRAQVEGEMTPLEAATSLNQRVTKWGLLSGGIASGLFAFEIAGHAHWSLIAITGLSAVLAWRSLYASWRFRKIVGQKTLEPGK